MEFVQFLHFLIILHTHLVWLLLIVVLIEKNLILDGAENLSFLYNREMAVTFENLEIIVDLCDIIFIEKYEIQKTFEGQVLVWIEGVYGEDLLLCFEVYFVFGRNFVAVVERAVF
jgi:hypothetical protein